MIFSDISGEHGTEKKGLSTKSLQQIREQEALCLVLRDFVNLAVEGTPDPLGDLEAFHIECVLADLQIVERRLDRARKEKAPTQEIAAFELMKATLEDGRPLRGLSAAERGGNGNLIPQSGTTFYNGREGAPRTVTFNLGADGKAISMTLKGPGTERTLQKLP